MRVLIFAIVPTIRKNKFPQIKINAKIYSILNFLLNSLHKNTILRNRVCSQLVSFVQKQNGIRMNYWFYIGYAHRSIVRYFYCTYSIKTKILSMLGLVLSETQQKLIPSKKHQSVLIAKLVPAKHTKKPNSRKNPYHTII